MNRILILLFLLLTGPVMADSYFCDNSIHARTLNVSWTECPIHGWGPYIKALYDGQSIDGVFHGRGTYTWEDGSAYIGWWKGGKMHGSGTLTFPNGDKYRGEWSKNQLLKGTIHTDAQNCLLRVSSNYYLPHEDACFESTGRCCKSSSKETEE